jgi:hypothetical protein
VVTDRRAGITTKTWSLSQQCQAQLTGASTGNQISSRLEAGPDLVGGLDADPPEVGQSLRRDAVRRAGE